MLDRCAEKPGRMCLYGIGTGWAPVLIAKWPRIGSFSSFDITPGRDGSLVLSASKANAHAIAVLSITADGVALEGLFFGPDEMATPAFKSLDGISYVARLKDGTLEPRRQPMRAGGPKDRVGHGMDAAQLTGFF